MKHILHLLLVLTLARAGRADTVISQNQLVKGSNVYAPCVLFDAQENKYKMWYGGWATGADKPHDNIYYRESADGTNWGTTYLTVINHSTLSLYHVNDPSVIKAWNGALSRWMYWIFFTGIDCDPENTNTCSISRHHIYAGSGFDGKTFGAYSEVIDAYDTNGVFSPSVVSINDTNGEFWLYYQISGIADRIILTRLTAGTTPVSTEVVYVSAFDGAHNPDVARKPDGSWTMLYNRIDTNNTFNIWKLTSTNGVNWDNDQIILYSGCVPFCIATTPNQRWITTNQYFMYYGLDRTMTSPACEVHGWRMSE